MANRNDQMLLKWHDNNTEALSFINKSDRNRKYFLDEGPSSPY